MCLQLQFDVYDRIKTELTSNTMLVNEQAGTSNKAAVALPRPKPKLLG